MKLDFSPVATVDTINRAKAKLAAGVPPIIGYESHQRYRSNYSRQRYRSDSLDGTFDAVLDVAVPVPSLPVLSVDWCVAPCCHWYTHPVDDATIPLRRTDVPFRMRL